MKLFFTMLAAIFGWSTAHGQTDSISTAKTGAIIEWETISVDLGTISYNKLKDSVLVFKFSNEGNAPLIIYNIMCGGFFDWVAPRYPKGKPILPGQKSELTLSNWLPKYGQFNKQFTVVSNAINGHIVVKVKGNILE